MTKEEVIEKYPSICYTCRHARKVTDKLANTGHVGCSFNAWKNPWQILYVDAKIYAEGWVDLRAKPFGNKSGITSNCQIITVEVIKCNFYDNL